MLGVLEKAFFLWGKVVGRFPVLFILAAMATIGGLSVGLKHVVVEENPQKIWVPPGSSTAQQQAYFGAAFDPFFRIEQVIFMDKGGSRPRLDQRVAPTTSQTYALAAGVRSRALMERLGSPAQADAALDCEAGNVLTIAAFKDMLQLQDAIMNTADSAGTTLDDICYKPVAGKGCLVESPLNYVKSNWTFLSNMTETNLQYALQCASPSLIAPGMRKPCWSAIGVPAMKDVVLGGQRCCEHVSGINGTTGLCQSCNTVAIAGFMTFLVNADPATQPLAQRWEKEVFLNLSAAYSSDELAVSYMAQRSIQDEISAVGSQNTFVVIVSYAAMLMYISLALGKFPHPVYSRMLLGLQGMCIVGGSFVAALGVCSLAGLKITMIVEEVVPFLILAIGVDNMFILYKAFDRRTRTLKGTYGDSPQHQPLLDDHSLPPTPLLSEGVQAASSAEPIEETLAFVLAEAGPTITAAAVGEVLAFIVGITTNIPALVQFCVVAAVAVAFDLVFQLTWFTAAIALDARRVEAGRLDLLPCFTYRRLCAGGQGSDGASVNSSSANEDQATGGCVSPRSHFWAFVLEGEFVKRTLENYYAPVLARPAVKALVLIVWLFCLVGSIIGAGHLQLGLPQQLVLPSGSYLETYFDQQSKYGDAGPPAYIVLQNVDYEDPSLGTALKALTEQTAELTHIIDGPVYSWHAALNEYENLVNASALAQKACPAPLDPSTTPVALRAHQFLANTPIDGDCCQQQGQCGAQFGQDVKFFWAPVQHVIDHYNLTGRAAEYALNVSTAKRTTTAPDGSTRNASNAGMAPLAIMTSRLRTQHVALRDQHTFISCMQGIYAAISKLAVDLPSLSDQALHALLPPGTSISSHSRGRAGAFSDNQHDANSGWLQPAPTAGGAAFPYSLTYVYYEQYDFIRGVAIENFLLALGAVFCAVMFLSTPAGALFTTFMVACITIDIVGLMWLWNPPVAETQGSLGADMKFGVDINAVSVVNLVMAVGLSVEFCVHITTSFLKYTGTRDERAFKAVTSMGSNVVTGITLTKLVGVLVLAWAPSKLFRLYYFRMYFSIIVLGAFHGLMVLPVLLSLVGPPSSTPQLPATDGKTKPPTKV